jgi:predicted DCC family thiol-disulfide oxidoreductase YuxK
MADRTPDSGPVMLYDGVCGFCNKSVQTILKHDRRGVMRFAALQSEFGRAALARHPELKGVDSVVLLERAPETDAERASTRSTAALRVASHLGGLWRLCLAAYVIPTPVRDFLYNQFARHRYRLFGKYDTCPLPSPEVRSRFLDG